MHHDSYFTRSFSCVGPQGVYGSNETPYIPDSQQAGRKKGVHAERDEVKSDILNVTFYGWDKQVSS